MASKVFLMNRSGTFSHDQRLRAAAYGRSAAPNGIDVFVPRFGDVGVGAQWTSCRDAARSHGYHIPESPGFLFGDDGVSGRASRRPGLERLLDFVRSGHAAFSRLYVTNFDRLCRDDDGYVLLQWFEKELATHGIELRFVAEEFTRSDVDKNFEALAGLPDGRTGRR